MPLDRIRAGLHRLAAQVGTAPGTGPTVAVDRHARGRSAGDRASGRASGSVRIVPLSDRRWIGSMECLSNFQ